MPVSGKLDPLKETIPNLTGLDSSFIDDVDQRLQSFGYEIQDDDVFLVGFIIQKVVDVVSNKCNTKGIPEKLLKIAVDMVCGELFLSLKNVGKLNGMDIELDMAIKSITEGDTKTDFGVGDGSLSPEQRLDRLISHLINYGNEQFMANRKLVW